MLKIRLQGTTKDIKWFLKILGRDRRFLMNEPSEIMAIKGSDRFKRIYTEIFRDKDEFKEHDKSSNMKKEESYYGTGKRFTA